MNILFLIEGKTVPASRYRVLQLLPHWERLGIKAKLYYSYGDHYNYYNNTSMRLPYKLSGRLLRTLKALNAPRFDMVFSQRNALPFTALPEMILNYLNNNLIFDFDDHLGIGSDGQVNPVRERAFYKSVSYAKHVIAGNVFLANMAKSPSTTTIIPTVVDTNKYTPSTRLDYKKEIVIGWMGTYTNFESLRIAFPALRIILKKYPHVKLRIVSNSKLPDFAGDSQVEQITWSAKTEVELLRSFDIGLMPLEDDLAQRGKCGFKMLQYMSIGVPVVVSAVGTNVEIFNGSQAGFCIKDEQWVESLTSLIEDRELRVRCGELGRQHVERDYSIQSVMPKYEQVFSSVLSG
jgi:glycosyltransferase involved in cell wall biosynthesis